VQLIVKSYLFRVFIGTFTWRRLVEGLVLIPLCVYIGLFLIAWLIPDWIIFRPRQASYRSGPPVIKLRTTDGLAIAARFYENPAAEFTILFSHGNAEDLGLVDPFLRELRDSGFSILAYDYHGYGHSQGKPSEQNAYLDIQAAFDYLVNDRGVPPEKILVHGRSLGGGPSVELASKRKIGGLILESSFMSAARVLFATRIFPFDEFDNLAKISKIESPVLVIHGKKDKIIPFVHGQYLYDAVQGAKTSLWIDSAGHNNLFSSARTQYLDAIQKFANALSQEQNGPHGSSVKAAFTPL